MSRLKSKKNTSASRIRRVRARINGTAERPRLSVSISNMHVSAQIIDDEKGVTLAHATSVGGKVKATMTEKAVEVGKKVAAAAKAKKIKKIVFDRGSKQYHGRVKALADAARAEGLEF